jgi:hypothetical protein
MAFGLIDAVDRFKLEGAAAEQAGKALHPPRAAAARLTGAAAR